MSTFVRTPPVSSRSNEHTDRMRLLVDLPANVRAASPTAGRLGVASVITTLATARYLSVLLHRVAGATASMPLVSSAIKQLNQFLTGADIANDARIAPGLVLFHPVGVVIGAGARIGRRCVVQQGVTIGGAGGPRSEGVVETVIGDDVFLGAGARVIGAVTVGSRSIVGANAVVTKSVPPDSVAVGVPAVARPRS